MRTVLSVGNVNLLLPDSCIVDDVVKMVGESIKVEKAYGAQQWRESSGSPDVEIRVVPDKMIEFRDKTDPDEKERPEEKIEDEEGITHD